ncbi:glycosyltransferase family 92 protein RCOM_0530710-like [Sesamum indicum]|uniref:Glycosyltransferase family 92 protein n=1 Tax=Sesamum indicum TaxID=4182 RepID=A0A6I9UJC6_SESIN|nr:glycosyltransferase family 92 protein RCOM_0530710-like [Sesamum indicum]
MARKVRTFSPYVIASLFFCAALYHHFLRHAFSVFSSWPSPTITSTATVNSAANYAIQENLTRAAAAYSPHDTAPLPAPSPSSLPPLPPPPISTTGILLPDWEVLVIVSPETPPSNLDGYLCLFETNETSPARFSGMLQFPDRATFSCLLPVRARRRRLPFRQPVLLKSPDNPPERQPTAPPLLRWSYLVYDSLTTEDDVVLFVKGVNIRQGTNREPSEFRCVFGDDVANGVKTTVTTSMQEVFRCKRPEPTAVSSVGGETNPNPMKISLEIVGENRVVPSVAYYTPPRKLESKNRKSLLCASTMVYDVSKFLREWVLYHSRIGVEKFLLYDNGSDDDLGRVVDELVKEDFDINTYSWRWPKTQEAGFSHSALYAKDVCTWMMYLDVDEFVYSPCWKNLSEPSKSLLHPHLISPNSSSSSSGQISISCYEFGPSDQRVHPVTGVTQGYNCRRRYENRHKSIVLLDAIDGSLLNVIHHFKLRAGYRTRKLSTKVMVVNHYKYQAWPEFKAKFRRRVSAYVLDWTKKLNPNSNDRTPGLGFEAVEPQGWPRMFCEVRDNKLRDLVLKWFGIKLDHGIRMTWQR